MLFKKPVKCGLQKMVWEPIFWFSVAFGTNSSVSELKAMYATKMLIAEKYFVLAIGCYAME